ncbi:ABC transporter ATP-binding protein [Parvibacter caecicola]|uniref:ABC transporter ATP-binding protein n=1 Tax=Parvibacter caecicola TaxID=747645 RepID=UPI0027319059|nr:ABC transporter ATP-binding protein [Parvibacter caecicola]
MSAIVEVNNLVKRYGDVMALDHFDLTIQPGEVFGLLGPNGSGKTTAINCILQLLTYDKGIIQLFGQPMTPTAYQLKRKIGVVPQNVALFEELTVQENIDFFCALYVADRKERRRLVEEAISFVGLEDYRKFRPRKLSGGLLRRLNIACGIAHRPSLAFFDEPTVAVDPQSRNAILEGIRLMNERGCTVVYTSHYMEEVEEICSRIMIMDRGRAVAVGTNAELKAMVGTGERIRAEVALLPDEVRRRIASLPHVRRIEYDGELLSVHCEQGAHNVGDVLGVLADASIAVGRLYSEPPTLNDVFLEITGKQLRD